MTFDHDAHDADQADNELRYLRARSDLLEVAGRMDATARLLGLAYLEIPEQRRDFFVASVLAKMTSSQMAVFVKDVLVDAGHPGVGREMLDRMRSLGAFRNRLAHDQVLEQALHRGELIRLQVASEPQALTIDEMEDKVAEGAAICDRLLEALRLVSRSE